MVGGVVKEKERGGESRGRGRLRMRVVEPGSVPAMKGGIHPPGRGKWGMRGQRGSVGHQPGASSWLGRSKQGECDGHRGGRATGS